MDTEYKYKVFFTENIDSVNWLNSAIKRESVRYNLEGNKFIIRLIDPSLETETLNHEEALSLMLTPEWNEENIEI